MTGHLRADRLTAIAESDIGAISAEQGDAHLEQCAACRGRLEQINRIRARLAARAASVPAFAGLEEQVMSRVLTSPRPRPQAPTGVLDRLFPWPMAVPRRALTRGVVVAALLVLAVAIGGISQISSQAWTLEQSIEAARPLRGVYLSGTLDGRVGVQVWARGRLDRMNAVDDLLLRTDGGVTVQVHGNRTVYHFPGQPTAYTDDAQTAGLSPLPGAAFLELVRKVSSAHETDSRVDLLRLRKLIVLRAQLTDGEGPKSFELEFDANTKLLTRLVFWRNLQRAGTPAFAGDVQYPAEMPDALFAGNLPGTIAYRERPVEVPTEMTGLLATGAGVSFEGGDAGATSRRAVEEVYRAVIARDHERVRQLAPVTRLWSDVQLEAAMGGADGLDRATEVVSIGDPRPRGASPLGPLVVVPVVVRHADGELYDEKMIVQVRPGAGGGSCVVFRPYGLPYPAARGDAR